MGSFTWSSLLKGSAMDRCLENGFSRPSPVESSDFATCVKHAPWVVKNCGANQSQSSGRKLRLVLFFFNSKALFFLTQVPQA